MDNNTQYLTQPLSDSERTSAEHATTSREEENELAIQGNIPGSTTDENE